MSSNSSGRSAINNLKEVTMGRIGDKIPPAMKSSGRGEGKSWTLKGNNLNNDYNTPVRDSSKSDLSYIQNPETVRPPSNRLNSIRRPESSGRSSQNNIPTMGEIAKIGPESTIIHVIDENNKKQKDFRCSLPLLLKHMKYFEKHLKASESTEDIDISVH